jgi:hypothetical protein
MSIELSIKQMVEEQVQKVTDAWMQRLNTENHAITQKLKWTENKLEEALNKLASHNNLIGNRELTGDKIDGGVITNFASTGIKDNTTKRIITLSDGKIQIDNNLEVDGTIHCKTLFYYQAKTDSLDVARSIRINEKEVIYQDRLGNSVTKSKLQELGVLNELNAADTLYVMPNQVGINTKDPVGALGVKKNDIQISIDVKGSTAFVGTPNSDDFSIGTGGEPTLFVSADNRVGIKIRKPKADLDVAGPIRFQGQTHQYNDSIPKTGTYTQGDIVWNTKPVRGSVLGWVCTESGSPGLWSPFASIE